MAISSLNTVVEWKSRTRILEVRQHTETPHMYTVAYHTKAITWTPRNIKLKTQTSAHVNSIGHVLTYVVHGPITCELKRRKPARTLLVLSMQRINHIDICTPRVPWRAITIEKQGRNLYPHEHWRIGMNAKTVCIETGMNPSTT